MDTLVRELYLREKELSARPKRGVVCSTPQLRPLLHAERNDRLPARTLHLLQFPEQLRFHILRIDDHLACGNLFVSSAVKTEFANSEAAVRSHGRTKRAARHWPGIVKIAQSGLRIEHRAHLIVSKFREPLLRLRTFVEHARFHVAGKLRRQPLHRIPRPRANSPRPSRVCLLEITQPLLQPHRIQLIDDKNANAALRASRTTHQPLAATPRGIGQSYVHDRSEEHTSELQSRRDLVCRLLLEKKKKKI